MWTGTRAGLSRRSRSAGEWTIGRGVDATEFDRERGFVYFSSGDGTLSVFRQESPDRDTLVESVKTQPSARTRALDRKTGRVFLSAAEFGPRLAVAPGNPQPRPPVIPGSFSVLIIGD